MGDPVDELRARIAIADRRLLAAVNDRLRLVEELRRAKEEQGLEFVDPDQERRLTDALVAANDGPLSEGAVRELIAAVLDLTKRELGRAPG